MRTRLLLSSAIALMLAAPAFAQQPPAAAPGAAPATGPATAPAAAKLSQADMAFVQEAAMGGMAEVELGRIAERNAQHPQVKEFGARMVKDHDAANAQLTAIATGKGSTLPQNLDQQHAQMRDRLAHMHGDAFDRDYIRMMVDDHDKDVKAFEHQAQTGQDPEIKRFAQETLAVIREHDRMAHDLAQSLTETGTTRPPR